MVSYERQFDLLVDSAEQLSAYFAAKEEEIEALRAEKEGLQAQLDELCARVEAGHVSPLQQQRQGVAYPFVKRPPGGYGDDVVEEELVKEVDDENDDGDGDGDDASPVPQTRPAPRRRGSSPLLAHVPSPLNLLRPRRSTSVSQSPTPVSSIPPSRARTPILTASPATLSAEPSPIDSKPPRSSPLTDSPFTLSSPFAPATATSSTTDRGPPRGLSLPPPHLEQLPKRQTSLSFALPESKGERGGGS